MFTYSFAENPEKTVVVLEGDMDIEVTEIMQEELTPKLLSKKEIELNFERISFVDSSGIGLLITLVKDIQERGNKVVITHLSPDVKTVFHLLQLHEILGDDVFEELSGLEEPSTTG